MLLVDERFVKPSSTARQFRRRTRLSTQNFMRSMKSGKDIIAGSASEPMESESLRCKARKTSEDFSHGAVQESEVFMFVRGTPKLCRLCMYYG